MSFSIHYRSVSSKPRYFCYICNSRRKESQVEIKESGEIMCLKCKQTGFVEKVNVPQSEERNTSYSRRNSQNSTQTQVTRQSISDPFNSLFGVSLDQFVQRMFEGSVAIPMTSTDQNVPMGIRFLQDFTGYTGAATGSQAETNPALTIFTNEEFSRIFNSLVNNPFDDQAMNQILNYVMENDPNRYGSPPASRAVVESLNQITLDAKEAKSLDVCAICTEEFKEGDKILWLTEDKRQCGHPFHVTCIIPWLRQRNSCPVCRFELPTDDEDYNRERAALRARLAEEVQRNINSLPNKQENKPTTQ